MSDPSHGIQSAAFAGLGAVIAAALATVFGFVRGLFRGKVRESEKNAAETERTEITAKLRTHKIDVEAEERDEERKADRMRILEDRIEANHAESLRLVSEHSEREAAWARDRGNAESEWVRQIARLEGRVEGMQRRIDDLESRLDESERGRDACEERARKLLEENERLRREGQAA
jgi:chromosome segregation ATPase